MDKARRDLMLELGRLGAKNVILSTNIPLRQDGFPRADWREPEDPGVAVYFERRVGKDMKPFAIACDTYNRVYYNVRAIGLTVEALRTIDRHGSATMLEQAFTGFTALPPAQREKPWWEVLGVDETAGAEVVLAAFRELAQIHHPDKGGNHERMAEINAAYQKWLKL